MNTYAMQMLLHFQSMKENDEKFDSFLKDVVSLAEKHDISFDDYQSFCLSGKDYMIAPCKKCGHLTVNKEDVRSDIENILPDFWFYVRRGKVTETESICELCGNP